MNPLTLSTPCQGIVTISLVCVSCGADLAAHTLGNCPNQQISEGFILIDSHALDDIPPARRALERARLAQEAYDQWVDVQLSLSSVRAFR
jgi:hypothetical protein